VKLVLDLIGERESSLFKWLTVPGFSPEFISAKVGTWSLDIWLSPSGGGAFLIVPLWRGCLPHCPPLEGVQGEVWKLIEIIYAATTNASKNVQTPDPREGGELNDRLFTKSLWFKLLL